MTSPLLITGASGTIGNAFVAKAPADGYTLLFGTTSDMVVTPIANRAAGYSVRDFTPIAKVGVTPMTFTARPGLGVNSIDQLVALARQRPNGLSVGTTGNASLQAFATVALQRAAGRRLELPRLDERPNLAPPRLPPPSICHPNRRWRLGFLRMAER